MTAPRRAGEPPVEVTIVGAGPVGMTMALDLAQRGVATVLLEQTSRYAPRGVRCNHVSARTMEIFRRLGLARDIRAAGLPPDHPHDVVWRTAFASEDITRIRIPCSRDRYLPGDHADAGWLTPEPPHRINQQFLEPLLLDRVVAHELIELRFEHTVLSVSTAEDRAIAAVRRPDGEQYEIDTGFLIGCDGAHSTVRRSAGIPMEQTTARARRQTVSSLIEAPWLAELLREEDRRPAWCTEIVNTRQSGAVFAIDGHSRWLAHCHLPAELDLDTIDPDAALRSLLGVDERFEYRLLHRETWSARSALAERYRAGRVFLAGDAAHVWMPVGGYGMNAGIADAMNLSWKLALHLRGAAPRELLQTYEQERRPVTLEVAELVMGLGRANARRLFSVPAGFDEDSERGERLRREAADELYAANVQQFCCAGLNFGYHYARSPVVCAEPASPPGYTMGGYVPCSMPGCRAPHLWLADGSSLYDRLGTGFGLIVDGDSPITPAFRRAAAGLGVQLAIIDISGSEDRALYDTLPVLVRPDQHVAWRSGAGEDVPERVLKQALGHAQPAAPVPTAA